MNQPEKILVVDHQSATLRATRRLLESAGYITLSAPSGAEALRLAGAHKPDLMLVNPNLPDISGFDVCKQIKTSPLLRGMLVVILAGRHTGSSQYGSSQYGSSQYGSSQQSEELETCADGYISRPIAKGELLARVQALLRMHSTEAALRQSEERFRTMVNYTRDWEYWIGPDRQFIYVSPSCEAVCGYPAREFREDPDMLLKIAHPVDRAALLEHEESMFHSKETSSLEMRIINRSGEVRWIMHNCRPVYDAEGHWQGRRASNRDITERKMVIEVLERQNRTLCSMQEIAQEINGEMEISALLHNIMQRAVDLARADRGGGIYLYEAEKNVLRLVEGAGINQERLGITVGVDQGMAGHVFRSARPFVVDNYNDWAERAEVLVASPPSTVMGIPLRGKGQIIGVLILIANSMQRTFTEEDMRLAGLFAAQASIAIQNAQLYGKAQQEISERKQAEEALQKSHERLRALTFRLAQVEESQRRSMARELHDRVGQNLTALNSNLNIIRSQLPAEMAEKVAAWLDDSTLMVDEMMNYVRDVMSALRPPLLEDFGLLAALRQYGNQFTRRTGLQVEVLESGAPFPRPSLDVETTLFRVVQEALNNVARHARASQVTLRVEADRQMMRLYVSADGHGLDLAEIARDEKLSGWGLVSMRERIESVGGSLQISSDPGSGARIVVEIPDLPQSDRKRSQSSKR